MTTIAPISVLHYVVDKGLKSKELSSGLLLHTNIIIKICVVSMRRLRKERDGKIYLLNSWKSRANFVTFGKINFLPSNT